MNRLSEFRNKAGITQQQLADSINVSRKTIQNIESNTKVPSVKIAISISKVLNCKVEDIFNYSTDLKGSEENYE